MRVRGVYPRACGGTSVSPPKKATAMGLSPRVRGNRPRGYYDRQWSRSIPARAGEPHTGGVISSSSRVYPRACGGTRNAWRGIASVRGLSPRVRGNQPLQDGNHTGVGSIPARAGEPGWRLYGMGPHRVYPRACGGTVMADFVSDPSGGLSPRVRGNPSRRRRCA